MVAFKSVYHAMVIEESNEHSRIHWLCCSSFFLQSLTFLHLVGVLLLRSQIIRVNTTFFCCNNHLPPLSTFHTNQSPALPTWVIGTWYTQSGIGTYEQLDHTQCYEQCLVPGMTRYQVMVVAGYGGLYRVRVVTGYQGYPISVAHFAE